MKARTSPACPALHFPLVQKRVSEYMRWATWKLIYAIAYELQDDLDIRLDLSWNTVIQTKTTTMKIRDLSKTPPFVGIAASLQRIVNKFLCTYTTGHESTDVFWYVLERYLSCHDGMENSDNLQAEMVCVFYEAFSHVYEAVASGKEPPPSTAAWFAEKRFDYAWAWRRINETYRAIAECFGYYERLEHIYAIAEKGMVVFREQTTCRGLPCEIFDLIFQHLVASCLRGL